jgi:hypothetical protein
LEFVGFDTADKHRLLNQRSNFGIVGVRCRVFPDDIQKQILYSVLMSFDQVLILKGENKYDTLSR